MTGQLLLAAALVLIAYTVGYLLGRDDERRSKRRRQIQVGRARDREWQQTIGVLGSPKMN